MRSEATMLSDRKLPKPKTVGGIYVRRQASCECSVSEVSPNSSALWDALLTKGGEKPWYGGNYYANAPINLGIPAVGSSFELEGPRGSGGMLSYTKVDAEREFQFCVSPVGSARDWYGEEVIACHGELWTVTISHGAKLPSITVAVEAESVCRPKPWWFAGGRYVAKKAFDLCWSIGSKEPFPVSGPRGRLAVSVEAMPLPLKIESIRGDTEWFV